MSMSRRGLFGLFGLATLVPAIAKAAPKLSQKATDYDFPGHLDLVEDEPPYTYTWTAPDTNGTVACTITDASGSVFTANMSGR